MKARECEKTPKFEYVKGYQDIRLSGGRASNYQHCVAVGIKLISPLDGIPIGGNLLFKFCDASLIELFSFRCQFLCSKHLQWLLSVERGLPLEKYRLSF